MSFAGYCYISWGFVFQSHLQNLNDVDIDSADFKSLPSELQHEILTEMKETRKRNFLATMEELPEVQCFITSPYCGACSLAP